MLLDEEAKRAGGAPQREDDAVYRCAACGHALARTGDRLEAATHTFVNPEAIEFVLARFRAAPGCAAFGAPSAYWSWFPGHVWQVALCGGCGRHVGWSFAAPGSRFHGLIVDRIVGPTT
jgi:hypothetical protein